MKNLFALSSLMMLGSGLMALNPNQSLSVASNSVSKRNSIETPVGSVSIVVDKSDYSLSVYDSKGWYATYPVVFGNNSLEDKKMEGDKNTPEGTFHIIHKKVHDKWNRFMAIDYPTKESWDKFKKRKQRGEIPQSASIGGAIGIHGTWPNDDYVVDHYKNWTLGCVSLKNGDVSEIYGFTPVGTQVTIQK